jgi:hypothetical protein
MSQRFPGLLVSAVVCLATVAQASNLDDELDRALRGAWAVVGVEVYSGCTSTYSDNTIGAAGVAAKATHRFAPGELVKIDKVKLKRSRIDLLATLATPKLLSTTDGPFELYNPAECRAQLIFEVPREQVKAGDAAAILARIQKSLTLYSSLDGAQSSKIWNGRETEDLPPDYDLTLQRHAAWKAEQTNAAVDEGIRNALKRASRLAEGMSDDEHYAQGFGAGAEKMSDLSVTSCSSLLSASFSVYRSRAPKDHPSRWQDGYEDGQELVFNVLVAERLGACRVPVPPVDRP